MRKGLSYLVVRAAGSKNGMRCSSGRLQRDGRLRRYGLHRTWRFQGKFLQHGHPFVAHQLDVVDSLQDLEMGNGVWFGQWCDIVGGRGVLVGSKDSYQITQLINWNPKLYCTNLELNPKSNNNGTFES